MYHRVRVVGDGRLFFSLLSLWDSERLRVAVVPSTVEKSDSGTWWSSRRRVAGSCFWWFRASSGGTIRFPFFTVMKLWLRVVLAGYSLMFGLVTEVWRVHGVWGPEIGWALDFSFDWALYSVRLKKLFPLTFQYSSWRWLRWFC